MRLQVSRSLALTSGQLFVNLFLAFWLISEYFHNPFMQQYVSNFWTSYATLISVGVVLAAAVVLGSYLTLSRRFAVVDGSDDLSTKDTVSLTNLTALDVCPVCDNPLKELSQSRFQCRSCHRYFKK
jgi:hypothetical protein